jgi:hypothetical protein
MGDRPLTVFVSYSPEDELLKDELLKHLKVLERLENIEVWTEDLIPPGANRRNEIEGALGRANVAVLLVSASWLAAVLIDGHLPRLLECLMMGGLTIVPVILRDCQWDRLPLLEGLQVLPRSGVPIARSQDRDHAFSFIASELARMNTLPIVKTPRTIIESPFPSANLSPSKRALDFLEGVWEGTNKSTYCIKIINNEPRCVYCYAGNGQLTGEVYDWKLKDCSLTARYRWLARPVNGYMHFHVDSSDRLTGGWWRDEDVPDELVARLPHVPHMHPNDWVRQINTTFPDWAKSYLGKFML